ACKSSAYSTCSSEALIISLFKFIIFKTPFFFIFVKFSISFVFENVNIKYVKKNKEQLIKVTLYYSLLLFVISFFFSKHSLTSRNDFSSVDVRSFLLITSFLF